MRQSKRAPSSPFAAQQARHLQLRGGCEHRREAAPIVSSNAQAARCGRAHRAAARRRCERGWRPVRAGQPSLDSRRKPVHACWCGCLWHALLPCSATHVAQCRRAVAAGTAAFAYIFWCSPAAATPPLTDEEEEAVALLGERALRPFDAASEAHVALVHALWTHTFPARSLPAPKGPHWSELGFQGQDPSTDLRAAGLLSAECLLHFAQHRPETWGTLVRKERGLRSDWEYPVSAAGCNLAASLVDALGVARLLPQRKEKTLLPNRAFAALLARHPTAFEELFCSAYVRLDALWLEAFASYMDFPHICSRAIDGTIAALVEGSGCELTDVLRLVERS